jgi:phosphatidylserine/phosphatidylglycerophosphate/cardiolipin synthase-like enzyme
VSTFYIEWDRYGQEFLQALHDARRRGVHVVLLIDCFGQKLGGLAMPAPAIRRLASEFDLLRAAGSQVLIYTPPRRMSRWLPSGHHVKIQLTDHGSALFSSGNITASSHERWDEFSAIVDGPVVRPMLESFELFGVDVRPNDREQLAEVSRVVAGSEFIEFDYEIYNPCAVHGFFGPLGWQDSNPISQRLCAEIAKAQTSVRLTSFYFKPAPALRRAILAAARRGVRVEVFHSHVNALAETRLAWLAAASDFDELLAAGVEIYESLHGEHSKVVLIDDKLAIFGSYNFEHAADDRLAEAMLSSSCDRVVDPIREVLDQCASSPAFCRVTRSSLDEMDRKLRWGRRLVRPWRRWL